MRAVDADGTEVRPKSVIVFTRDGKVVTGVIEDIMIRKLKVRGLDGQGYMVARDEDFRLSF